MDKKFFFKRSVKEVKNFSLLIKATSVLCLSLVSIVAVTYFTSFLYNQFGAFTVSVNKYDMVKQGLTLSETEDFAYPISRLDAKSVKDITNISGDRIPLDVHNINGSHNGDEYVAYTFYVKNMGEDTVTYEYIIAATGVTKNVDKAIRVKLFKNGETTTYARTKTDGTGPEQGTTEFATADIVARQRRHGFAKNEVDKFTVVIWLEGDDPDCLDEIIGGQIKLEMELSIVEG